MKPSVKSSTVAKKIEADAGKGRKHPDGLENTPQTRTEGVKRKEEGEADVWFKKDFGQEAITPYKGRL